MKLKIATDYETVKDYINQALILDCQSYPDEYHLNYEQCLSYLNANNNIYFMLIQEDTNTLIGYLNFTPLTDEAYSRIRTGDSIDSSLKTEDILPYNALSSQYNGYFSSIVISKQHRKKGYSNILLDKLFDFIVEMSSKGIFFKKILADVLSPEGEHAMRKIGLSAVDNIQNDSNIMEMIMIPHSFPITPENKKIYDVYKGL